MVDTKVQVRRAYEDPAQGDGTRVLVDRIWPRGLTKARAALDEWCKEIAPSTELRKWYGHDPERFEEFGRRYRAERDFGERDARGPGPVGCRIFCHPHLIWDSCTWTDLGRTAAGPTRLRDDQLMRPSACFT
jgi:uncharacterized protein YeaO (DUF488 family)